MTSFSIVIFLENLYICKSNILFRGSVDYRGLRRRIEKGNKNLIKWIYKWKSILRHLMNNKSSETNFGIIYKLNENDLKYFEVTMNAVRTYAQINDFGNIVIGNLPFKKGELVEVLLFPTQNENSNLIEEWKLLFKDIQSNETSELIRNEDIIFEINDYRNSL